MARMRVTSVLEQQQSLRELGRIRFGERKPEDAKRPGRPIDFPRVSSQFEDVVREVAAEYGGEVQRWDRDGAIEWDVIIAGPLAVCCPPPPAPAPATTAYEQWANGFNTVRCDGVTCEYRGTGRWKQVPCICAERGIDPQDRDCKKTTRINVMIVGVRRLGLFRVETKSHYASEELPLALEMLRQSGRAGWMQMARRERRVLEWDAKAGKDKPKVKKFPVIVVDAPFLPDEVMHLERSPDMAALPAPATPALPRGARPQLGTGASIDPVGPQITDRPPPPREVAPVDLDDAEFEDEGEGEEPAAEETPAAPAEDAEWLAAREKLEQRASAADAPTLPGTDVPSTSTDPDAG